MEVIIRFHYSLEYHIVFFKCGRIRKVGLSAFSVEIAKAANITRLSRLERKNFVTALMVGDKKR